MAVARGRSVLVTYIRNESGVECRRRHALLLAHLPRRPVHASMSDNRAAQQPARWPWRGCAPSSIEAEACLSQDASLQPRRSEPDRRCGKPIATA